MNEVKILATGPSCWSWANIWKLFWAGGQLKASLDMGSRTKVRTAHQLATEMTATPAMPQRIWCPQARGRGTGLRLLAHLLSACWSALSSLICVSVSSFRTETEENGSDKCDQGKVGICSLRDRPRPQFLGGLAGSSSRWHSALFSDKIALFSASWRLLEKNKFPQVYSPTWKLDFFMLWGRFFFLLLSCWNL